MLRMNGFSLRTWVVRVAAVGALVGGLLTSGSLQTLAQAPMPRLTGCLATGSFTIQDPACWEVQPRTNGPRYGPINGVTPIVVQRGTPVRMSFAVGDIDFEKPTRPCGDLGCPYNSVLWRTAGTGGEGLSLSSGCGAKDITCAVNYAPSYVGDRGEVVTVILAQHFDGIYPVSGQAYVLYAAPLIYPAIIQAFDTAGQRVDVPSGYVGYAVRAGTNPTAAQCVAGDWYVAKAAGPTVPVPDCVTFPQWAYLSGADAQFRGYLPADSGAWTIVGHPQGDASAPLLSRPSPYRHASITMGHDDVTASIIGERRPTLSMDVTPESPEMELGDTQTVAVTVSAVGGEVGDLRDLVFDDPTILGVTDDGPLAVVGVAEAVPTGFALGLGASRTFQVTVQAVALGTGAIGGAVSGKDDIGGPARAEVISDVIGVEPGGIGGPGAPEPPVVTSAVVGNDGAPGPIDGTVSGAPGSSMRVSLFTAPAGVDCAQLLDGDGIASIGSFDAGIGDDGTGTFTGMAPLAPRTWVYGVSVTQEGVSKVGDCMLVAETEPTLSVGDTDVTEGTSKKDATELVFTVELSSPSQSEVRVRIETADDTATAPADYAAASTEVSIPAGQTSAEVRIPVVPDGDAEGDEELTLTLSAPVGAKIDTDAARATGTISDPVREAAVAVDLRGRWAVVEKGGDPDLRQSVAIDRQDQGSGDWSGRYTAEYVGSSPFQGGPDCRGTVCTFKLTGTIKGSKVTMRVATSGRIVKLSGTFRDRNGQQTVTLSGTGLGGTKGKLILTRKE
jgi:hypothetical protein